MLAHLGPVAAAGSANEPYGHYGPELRRARILIIDDDALSALLLERVLRRSGFANVWSTNDAEDGLRRVLTEKPDVLLLDLHMPGLDGFSLMHRLHQQMEPALRPAVLMLTADVATEVKEQALALGVRDFLNKPFPATETILRVENLLEVRLLTRRLAEENHELEALVAKRVAELAAVTDAAADGIFALDDNAHILSWNRGAEKMFGWSSQQVVGRKFSVLVPERLRDLYGNPTTLASRKEATRVAEWSSELVCLRRDGSEFAAELTLAGWEGEEGQFFAAVVRDITERRRAEEAERNQRRLEQFVSDVRLCFSDTGSLTHGLQCGAHGAVAHLGAAAAAVWLLNDAGGALELGACAGMDGRGGKDRVIPLGPHTIGWIAEHREPYLTNSLSEDPDYGEWAVREQVVAMAAHPLVIDRRLLGVMAMFSRAPLPDSALRALEAVANEVSAGIDRKRAAEALHSEQVFLRSLLQSLQEGILACDAEGRITIVNDALRRLTGVSAPAASLEEAYGTINFFHADGLTKLEPSEIPLTQALAGNRIQDLELVIKPPNGRPRNLVINGQPVYGDDGRKLGAVVAAHDITERKRVEAELERRTFRDTLTGLANRALFMDRLSQAISRVEPHAPPSAVFVLDLDNFNLVNESLGEDVGDRLLITTAERISAVLGPSHAAARVGGDQFAVLFEEVPHEAEVLQLAQALNEAVAAPIEFEGREIHLSASIGVALLRDPTQPAERLLGAAASAMARAAAAGRGLTELFDEDIRERALNRLEVEHSLRGAIERQELILHYQPELLLADESIGGVEALIRWAHPEWGMVPPNEFIPLAEETGMIIPIGRWVLGEACRSAARWAADSPENPVMVSVNLSARQLADPLLVETLEQLLAETGIDPTSMCLEITESVLMTDAEHSVATLRALKALGVRLAVDDFGTGYSSLSYLKRFPVDFLKIDRSFVDGLGRDPEDTAIVAAVVNVAHTLGLLVIAEGVETELQLEELRRLDCELGQGFFWSKAIPADEVTRLLSARRPLPAPLLAGAPTREAPPEPATGGRVADDAIAVLAHEMRAPLTVISGYAELLVDDIEGGDIEQNRKELRTIVRHAQHMAALIDTIVDVGAVETGRLSVKLETSDLAELVGEIVEDVEPALGEHRVEVMVLATATCRVDPRRIRQVLTNLLTNAAKFSPPGAPITVEVDGRGNDAKVSVIDRGPGVPPERIGDVFRKFARADRTIPGRGLGLYLSRSIARAHGGELSCRKASSGGAQFVLELPVAASSARRPPSTSRPETSPAPSGPEVTPGAEPAGSSGEPSTR